MSTNDKPDSVFASLLSNHQSSAMVNMMQKCSRSVIKFREDLLRKLIPDGMSDEDAVDFLKEQGIKFVHLPDGREELHGFGKKLGDVFSSVEEDKSNGIKFISRFTPCRRSNNDN